MKRPHLGAILGVALALFAATLPASADNVARMSISGAAIEWHAAVDHDGLLLRVSAPNGLVTEHRFASGEAASFGLFDRAGALRPDGSYTFELHATPRISAELRAALARAREAGDESAIAALRASGQMPAGMVQSGSFAIRGGAFVASEQEPAPARPAGLALRDQVIPDDLIVQGSICAGFDCVNNESFGFDTIRLKENNLRIKFEDTSVGTFPTNDWQLTANDSASGGSSKFSIEDITGARVPFTITAGASTNSIFVDSTGRVGLRSSTPVLDLHINTSNTPAIRLEQNNTGGFTAQTWDIAGNEANFFVRDVTGGSRLSFRIRPGAPTSSVDIDADGNVGVGTGSPDDRLNVVAPLNTNGGVLIQSQGTGLSQLSLERLDSVGASVQLWRFRVQTNGDFVYTDATNSVSPFRIVDNAGASDRLVISTTGVDVTGQLRVNATVMNVPDYVFEPNYRLDTIEEHAAKMWQGKSLPAVGPGQYNDKGEPTVDVAAHQFGMLEELEKAHIYIEQLHKTIKDLESRLGRLENDRP